MFQKLKAKFSKPKLSREERILKLKSDFKISLKDTLSLFFKSIFAIAFTFLYVILGVFVVRFLIPLSIMTVYYSVVHLFTSDIMVLTYFVLPAVFIIIVYSAVFVIFAYKFTRYVYNKLFKRCANE